MGPGKGKDQPGHTATAPGPKRVGKLYHEPGPTVTQLLEQGREVGHTIHAVAFYFSVT